MKSLIRILIVKLFSHAIKNKKTHTIKVLCHKDCQLTGFRNKEGTLSSFISEINKAESHNRVINEQYWKDPHYVFKNLTVRYKVAEILSINASCQLTMRFTFRKFKIKQVDVMEWLPQLDLHSQAKWEAYTQWAKSQYNCSVNELMDQPDLATSYLRQQ